MRILYISDFFNEFYISIFKFLDNKYKNIDYHFLVKKLDEVKNEKAILLPDKISLKSKINQEFIIAYSIKNKIDIVLFPQIWDIDNFIRKLKKNNIRIKCVFLLHSCPDLVVSQKREYFKRLTKDDVKSYKTFLGYYTPNLYLWILKNIWRRWSIRQYESFDNIVLLSNSYIEEYEFIMKRNDYRNKLITIANPIIQRESSIPIEKKKKQIIFVGRLSEEKALIRLLEIWKNIQCELEDWNLLIVGDGPTRVKDEKFVLTNNLERVHFIGFQPSISLIDESSILCITSDIEGLPTVFTEAMNLGVVPIGFDSFSAIYDMIDSWDNGVIIPAFDNEAYQNALIKLISDDKLRYKLATNAKKKVKQYNVEIIAEKWKQLFDSYNIIKS